MSGRTGQPGGTSRSACELGARFEPLASASLIVAAVSGGPDSTALMHELAWWCAGRGRPDLAVATVDHGLRPASAAEAALVGEAARALGLPHATLAWTGRAVGRASQEAARRARYRLLTAHGQAIGASHLATAHTLDDQAETIMMRMAAGSGLAGLGGMRPEVRRGTLRHVRPFLAVPKAEIVALCRARGWAFVEDPANADPTFARARWRMLLPLLAAEGLDAKRLARLSGRLARADEALGRIAELAYARLRKPGPPGTIVLDAQRLAGEPFEIALRVLMLALGRSSLDGPTLKLERLEACLAVLLAAYACDETATRTIAGRIVSLDRGGSVTIAPEPERRRGRRAALTEIVAARPPSLGIGGGRA